MSNQTTPNVTPKEDPDETNALSSCACSEPEVAASQSIKTEEEKEEATPESLVFEPIPEFWEELHDLQPVGSKLETPTTAPSVSNHLEPHKRNPSENTTTNENEVAPTTSVTDPLSLTIPNYGSPMTSPIDVITPINIVYSREGVPPPFIVRYEEEEDEDKKGININGDIRYDDKKDDYKYHQEDDIVNKPPESVMEPSLADDCRRALGDCDFPTVADLVESQQLVYEVNPVKMPVKIPCFTAEESESQPQLLSPHADLTCETLRAAYRKRLEIVKSQPLSRNSLPRGSQKIQDIINKKLDEMKEEKEKLERWIREMESLRTVQSQPAAEEVKDKQTVSDKIKVCRVLKDRSLKTSGEQKMNDLSQDNKEIQENEGTEGDNLDKGDILEEEAMDTDNSQEIELDNDKSRADGTRYKKRRLEEEEEEEEVEEGTTKRRKIVNESSAPQSDISAQITNLSRDIPQGSRNQSERPVIVVGKHINHPGVVKMERKSDSSSGVSDAMEHFPNPADKTIKTPRQKEEMCEESAETPRQKEEMCEESAETMRRGKRIMEIKQEAKLAKWFSDTELSGIPVTFSMLRNMAKGWAPHLSSDQLLFEFLSRFQLNFRPSSGR
ncbi:uncharacterized protein LOC134822757 [Bolinopsis microptera]|uniref:uncharacterized protein LOC134822757 n=1 Tax=Bolinopsis microptera TaxID=2820187 RepID=UPI003079D479